MEDLQLPMVPTTFQGLSLIVQGARGHGFHPISTWGSCARMGSWFGSQTSDPNSAIALLGNRLVRDYYLERTLCTPHSAALGRSHKRRGRILTHTPPPPSI